MRSFHVTLHGCAVESPSRPWTLDDLPVTCREVSAEQLRKPLEVTFEEAYDRLAKLPRMFIELDGSFVWVSDSTPPAMWQVDGELIDGGPSLQYVSLRGSCPETEMEQLLAIFRPSGGLLIQLIRQALVVDETEFKRVFCRG